MKYSNSEYAKFLKGVLSHNMNWQRISDEKEEEAKLLLSVIESIEKEAKNNESYVKKAQKLNKALHYIIEKSFYQDYKESFNVLTINPIPKKLKESLISIDKKLNPSSYKKELKNDAFEDLIDEFSK